ncbi:MAG TPA: hypothetical protein VLE95_05430 [Chlamydiales bacterium]|nr:hypothetical protein [Chlamydiales bacterium]
MAIRSLSPAPFLAPERSSFQAHQTLPPPPPNFVRNDGRWKRFADYFSVKEIEFWQRHPRPVQLFPSACDTFPWDLEFLLAMSYNGKCRKGEIVLAIEGEEAVLSHQVCDLRAQGGTLHFYLMLMFKDGEWIVDPTWKQFAGKQVKEKTGSDDTEFCPNDPYNERLEREFPNILVIRRDELTPLFRRLGREADSEAISWNSRHWDRTNARPVDTLKECIEEASVYTSKFNRPYFDLPKWRLFQEITRNQCPSFEEFSRSATGSRD